MDITKLLLWPYKSRIFVIIYLPRLVPTGRQVDFNWPSIVLSSLVKISRQFIEKMYHIIVMKCFLKVAASFSISSANCGASEKCLLICVVYCINYIRVYSLLQSLLNFNINWIGLYNKFFYIGKCTMLLLMWRHHKTKE